MKIPELRAGNFYQVLKSTVLRLWVCESGKLFFFIFYSEKLNYFTGLKINSLPFQPRHAVTWQIEPWVGLIPGKQEKGCVLK